MRLDRLRVEFFFMSLDVFRLQSIIYDIFSTLLLMFEEWIRWLLVRWCPPEWKTMGLKDRTFFAKIKKFVQVQDKFFNI